MAQVKLLENHLQRGTVVQCGGDPIHQIAVQFSSDAKWLFVCCGCCVQVYSSSSHQVVCTLEHSSPVTAAVVNPRNHMQLIVTLLNGNLSVWDYLDATLLKSVDYGAPVHKFAIRPGKAEPKLFFVTEREKMCIVGVSTQTITERDPATPPSDQLMDAVDLITTSNTPKDFAFTYTGAHLVSSSGNGKKLIIYDFESECQVRHKSRYGITALACHPSQLCIATGNGRGEIKLWYDFSGDRDVVVTTLHWHAHAVSDLCFTTDGTYLLSGGEESVLVLWQLKTSHKQFRPRLGSPITRVSCNEDDTCFAVSLQNNVIQLVSGLNSDVEGTLGGLRRAFVAAPKEEGVWSGLVLHPRSRILVLNSTPGLLQFFDTETRALSSELDVVGLNHVSRTDNKPIVPTTVDHVAFSPSGDWMVTVESRDDGNTSPELRMKFWKFVTTQQRYMQNTCVDPPHDKKVTSLSFQPPAPHIRHMSSTADTLGSTSSMPMVVTSGRDDRFKVWVLVDEGEEEGERRNKGVCSWACRSVGYYHRLTPLDTAFSQDGSLLAVNFTKNVTVWDPYSCELRQTFSTSYSNETFRQVVFGRHSCSQYLLASATEHVHVWDLLSCRLLWRAAVSISYLTPDPFTHLVAAFVPSDKGPLLYLLEPCTATPLSVHSLAGKQAVVGAVFVPRTLDNKKLSQHPVWERSILHFITRDQLLYSLDTSTDSAEVSEKQPRPLSQSLKSEAHDATRKSYMEIFGQRKRQNGMYTSTGPSSSLSLATPLLDGAPHVLPPPTSLAVHFIKRLLPPAVDPLHRNAPQDSDTPQELQDNIHSSDMDSSDDETEEVGNTPKRQHIATADRDTRRKGKEDTRKDQVEVLKTGTYEWLTDYFKSDA